MALPEVFPTKIDVGGSLLGRKFTEDKWEDVFSALHVPYVITGLDQNALSGLDWTVNAGTAVIGGFRLKTAQTLIALPASSTVNLWLELTKDGNGDINGAQFTTKTDATTPTGFPLAMVIRQFITGASSVTRQHDRRSLRGNIYHTIYRGGDTNSNIVMLGFTPRCVEIFKADMLAKFQFIDGVSDVRLLIQDTGAGVTDLTQSASDFIKTGGINVGSGSLNGSGISYYLTAW